MDCPIDLATRRFFLRGTVLTAAAFYHTPGLFAEQLAASSKLKSPLFVTPGLTEGPFYPDRLPLDRDNDLIILSDRTTPAIGQITHLTGRVLDASGTPLKNATVEIWQCDAKAVYLHSADSDRKKGQQDQNFQGFGTFTTGAAGEYRFRTIKPVEYPGRPAPHIHFKVKQGNRDLLTSQIFVRDYPGNLRDGVYLGIRDLVDRELVLADFVPLAESKLGELAARFDIVVGRTPDDRRPSPRRPIGT